jgi:cytochrome c-type biogenesis protein CcmH/NrfG
MFKDSFDRLLLILLAVAMSALVVLLGVSSPSSDNSSLTAGLNKALEKETTYQARVALLQKLYAPVEIMQKSGDLQGALFRLDDLARTYPGEAHGYILKGEILHQMGAKEEAVASYVHGIKLSGDYIDRKSPLSRRAEIQRLTDEGVKEIGSRAKANPGNVSLAVAMKNVNYLQSRLAGGCE